MEGALGRVDEQYFDLDRLRGFSDAVFSIAITVIVLQMNIPGPDTGGEEFLDDLRDQGGLFLSYAVSFAVIGRYWLVHHKLFDLLERADGRLAWLNMGLLLLIVFLPFPAEVLGLYSNLEVAVVFYGLIATLLGVVNSLMWVYATKGHRLVPDALDGNALRIYRWQSIAIPVVFTLFTFVGRFDAQLAYFAFLLFIPANWVVALLIGRVQPSELDLEDELEERRDDARLREELREGRPHPGAAESEAGDDRPAPGAGSALWRSTTGRLITGRSLSSLDRLVAFSDGVYAIAITLLGLQFEVPVNSFDTNGELAAYLRGDHPADLGALYWSYLLTFGVLGVYWFLHHRYFLVIRAQNEPLRNLNLLHLFFITSIPFASEIIAGHDEEPISVMIYALSAGMVGLTLSGVWLYAWRARLIPPSVTDRAAKTTLGLSMTMPTVFLVSIPFALAFGVSAQFFWLVGFVAIQILRRKALSGGGPSGPNLAGAR